MSIVKRKSAPERKAEIVEAVLKLSMDVGPGSVTTEALAKHVGVSQGAIFRHFPTKTAIWSAVFDTLSRKMEQSWGNIEQSSSPSERLRLLVRAQLSVVVAVPALPSIISSRELQNENVGIKQGVLALMGRFYAGLKKEIQAGIDTGELRDGIDADETANMVIAILQGTVLRWSISPKKFDLIAEGDKMLTLALCGLQKNQQSK
jgi:AcrR family transcriptional regulator